MRQWIHVLVVFGICLAIAGSAEARSKRNTTYRYDQLWSTTVRFLRVDNRYPITEKAKKDGYILFEYKEEEHTFQGALELIPTVSSGKHYIRVSVQIASMPGYVETVFLNRLMKKLRKEHGDPPPAQKVREPSDEEEDETEDGEESPGDGKNDDTKNKNKSQKEQ
ncbi:MAG: hypothetical protein GY762_04930 [Proteobacteria bacterium]|nr:hypothetical protein [Pseudomonadota bacterium]